MKKSLEIENWPVDLPGSDRKVKSGLVIGLWDCYGLWDRFSNRLTMHAMAANGPARPPDAEDYLLSSTHEEADTILLLHALSAIRNGCKIINIRASDTDIVVIALYLFEQLSLATEGLEQLFIKSKDYFIPVHDVEEVFSARSFLGRGYEPFETQLKQRMWLHIWNQYAKRKLEVGDNIPENII